MKSLSKQARKLLNDPGLIALRDRWFDRMEGLFQNTPDEFCSRQLLAVNGVLGRPKDPELIYRDPEGWVVDSLENLAQQLDASKNEMMFVPPCIESALCGVHFIDRLFGSQVFYQDGQWYNRYLEQEVGQLKPIDLNCQELWQTAKRAAQEFVRQDVALPLFGLPTIASCLNIAVNLYGEEILVSMLIDPDSAVHDLKIINQTLCEIHQWYRDTIPQQQLQPVISWNRTQPPGYGQLCGCTTQLISKETYDCQIAPLDNELLGIYPNGGMIHLCGSHGHLIESFRRMPLLKAIQINDRAAEDLQLYHEGLREDQVIYLNPCEGMTVEQALRITGGKRLVIADTISRPVCCCGREH